MKLMISEILHADEIVQNQLLKYLPKKPLHEKVDIFRLHGKILHMNRQKFPKHDISELSYCSLIRAIQIAKNNEKMLKEKSFGNLPLEEIEKLSKQQIEALKASNVRKKTVREKLVPHLPYIISLQNENISFRQISMILLDKYRIKASYSTIYNVLKEIK